MYKTVRHGENSLQYTILPQTEEVLNNSGIKGKGRDYSPSIHVRRSHRRPIVRYVLLVICGIIVALAIAIIPYYMLDGSLYDLRSDKEATTQPHLAPAGRDIAKSRKKELKIAPEILLPIESSTTTSTSTTTQPTTTYATTTSEKPTTPPWTMPALRSWKSFLSSTTIRPLPTEDLEHIPLIGTPSGSIRLLDSYMSLKPWEKDVIIRPTVTPESVTFRRIFKYPSIVASEKPVTVKPDNVIITTKSTTTMSIPTILSTSERNKMMDLKDTILSVDDDDDFKESLEVDEVFPLPPLKPDTAAPGMESDEVTVSKAGDGGWYGARWPFVDTSSYFQWTGYSPGDNLLLPLLVAALSSIALVLLLALAVRRKKRSQTSAQLGKLSADLHTDDNTNLLTSENPEEAEE